jgi:hypothetical protein
MAHEPWSRRALISGLGTSAAAAALAFTPRSARAQEPGAFSPARHPQDEWMDRIPGRHRVFIDSASAQGGSDALLYANNLFAANQSGYELGADDLAIIVCFRHYSTPFGYGNAVWAKYGEPLAGLARYESRGGEVPTANPHLSRGSRVSSRAADGLAGRGVHYAICDMATRAAARRIATAAGGDADAIYDELVADAIPNAHFAAAGVVALTRAQEFGYSVLIAG